jgi:hypothetical protein
MDSEPAHLEIVPVKDGALRVRTMSGGATAAWTLSFLQLVLRGRAHHSTMSPPKSRTVRRCTRPE